MRKNVASQNIAGQMNSRTDGSPLTATVSAFVTIDGGTQTAGGGTLTHEGNGHWNYAPTQAETNGNHLAFTFTHATGVTQTVNVYTVSYDPHDIVDLGLTNLDATISSRLATAGYTAPDNTSIAAILVDTAEIGAAGAGLTAINLPDQIMNITGDITGSLSGSVGSVTGLTASNLDATVSSRLATAGYTAPDNAGIVAIKAKTDSLAFTVAGKVDANILVVNGVTVAGTGAAGNEWGPA